MRPPKHIYNPHPEVASSDASNEDRNVPHDDDDGDDDNEEEQAASEVEGKKGTTGEEDGVEDEEDNSDIEEAEIWKVSLHYE